MLVRTCGVAGNASAARHGLVISGRIAIRKAAEDHGFSLRHPGADIPSGFPVARHIRHVAIHAVFHPLVVGGGVRREVRRSDTDEIRAFSACLRL